MNNNAATDRVRWLEQLPSRIADLQRRWRIVTGPPFPNADDTCAWVAPAVRDDGTRAVLKLGMPHFEALHEIDGLRYWNGDPTVEVFDADVDLNAMLLERCEPGEPLRTRKEPDQDVVISALLRALWRRPGRPHRFRPIAAMIAHWAIETRATASSWPDTALVEEGLATLEELSRPSADDVLLATDLHAGNVLSAARRPWLAIDPKPFIGDRCYDATQHLLNCRSRVMADSQGVVRRFSDLLEVDSERVRLWLFARCAAQPRDRWNDDALTTARALA